jgi:cellulose synthase/poly-beta-1,6-N-acetylglucosamine synthase-like glycosyltransferase
MSSELVSVVIPAYNAEATIAVCVNALQGQAYGGSYEIIVVDDGSTDGTAQAARRAGAKVISARRGRPAAARNAGICAARGGIVCCTDADCAPHSDWLRQIAAPFEDPDVAACKGSYATSQRELVARFVQLEYEDKYDLLRTQESIDFIDTYSAAYRRDILLANGGFDERFDYLEDQELSFRLAAQGHRMVFQEAAVVDHLHNATLSAYTRKKAIIGYWKAQVVRRFPGRVVKDSHTPQVMKAQMLLATFFIASLMLGLIIAIFGAGRWGMSAAFALAPAALAALIFLATTVPFVRKAWPKDQAVALASPLLLFARALALSAGYGWGVLKPRRDLAGWPSNPVGSTSR